MITPEQRAEARRLFFAEHLTMNMIASKLGIHHNTVKEALETEKFNARIVFRPSMVDPFVDFIVKVLEDFPKIRSTRLHQMLYDRGFRGSVQQLRRRVKMLRPKVKRAYLPQTKFPGEEAQVDWAHFGTLKVGDAVRKLSLFIMVLAFSRLIYARFVFEQTLESFLSCHVRAFRALQGVPRVLRMDNLKAAVIERYGAAIRYHPSLLEMAGYYCFRPFACNPYAGNEKGRCERQIRHIRDNFWPARHFRTIEDANRQLADWLVRANDRPWPDDDKRRVIDVWEEEKPKLLALPEHDFAVTVRHPVRSGKMPFVRFDLNDYSIPYPLVREPLTLVPSENEVRIFNGKDEIAHHRRSYDRGKRIKNEAHFKGLYETKPGAQTSEVKSFLVKVVPDFELLFQKMVEEGVPIGKAAKQLMGMLEEYGVQSVHDAVREALDKGHARPNFIAAFCKTRLLRKKAPPSVPIVLPDREDLKRIIVTHHDLAGYDGLAAMGGDKTRDQSTEGGADNG